MGEIDKQIGARIRTLRQSAGLSQTDLGRSLDISFQQVQKYESGNNRVSASRLLEIAKRLAVPPTVFFDGLQDDAPAQGKAPTILSALRLNKELLEVATRYDALPAQQKKSFLDFLRSLGKVELT